jgi:LPXTG-site transpeptidase (sortase) family protein
MDVPSGTINVAWFALGPNPGEIGSAVIGGHYGIYEDNRGPTVFYYLDQMKVGDKVYIENDKGGTLVFQVREIKLFDRNADATTVFTSDDGLAHLNLITCEGIWNRVAGTYPSRRVVFTDLLLGGNEVSPTTPLPKEDITKAIDLPTFYRSLRVGTQGLDVKELQTALGQIGISSGIVDGLFGRMTRDAVVKYQTSAGLLPDGIFGPLTKSNLLAELGGDTGLPNAGEKEVVPSIGEEDAVTTQNTLTWFIKSLFETPTDGLITSLLLIAIFFMTLKIILRL